MPSKLIDTGAPVINLSKPITTIAHLLCVLLISTACSNDISPEHNRLTSGEGSANSESLEASSSVRGYLLISETSDRGTVDAYFLRQVSQPADRELIWSQGESSCYFSSELAESNNRIDPQQFNTPFNAGETITIDTRGGTFLSLLKHEIDGVTTYAPDARWVSVDFPEDAMISISGSEHFPAMTGVNVKRQTPMVGTLPMDGMLAVGDSTITWIKDAAYSDSIHIRLNPRRSSQYYLDSESSAADTVICDVDDSGVFQLPDEVITALGEHLSVGVSLSRRRTTVHNSHGDNPLTVLQISHGMWQDAT